MAAQGSLPDGPGRGEFQKVCASCHGLEQVMALKLTPQQWKAKVDAMVGFGATGTPAEFDSIVEYLARNFAAAPGTTDAGARAVPTRTLPEGAGRELIGRLCAGCHKPNNLTAYQHTPEEWTAILVRMGERVRVPSTKNELDEIASYLAKNFPKVDDPAKVNVNKAPAEEIASRLGFTPQEAERIIEFRATHSPFASWGDLLIIYGVDGKKVKAAKDHMGF